MPICFYTRARGTILVRPLIWKGGWKDHHHVLKRASGVHDAIRRKSSYHYNTNRTHEPFDDLSATILACSGVVLCFGAERLRHYGTTTFAGCRVNCRIDLLGFPSFCCSYVGKVTLRLWKCL